MLMIAFATLIGATWMLPVAVIESWRAGFDPLQLTLSSSLAIGFLGVGCSFLATLLYFRALGVMASQNVGVYLYSITPMTVLAAAFYLREPIGVSLIAGAALVLAGVYMTERAPRAAPEPEPNVGTRVDPQKI